MSEAGNFLGASAEVGKMINLTGVGGHIAGGEGVPTRKVRKQKGRRRTVSYLSTSEVNPAAVARMVVVSFSFSA